MVMQWAPRSPNPDQDPCQGVDEYIAQRAGPSGTFILINQVFFYVFLGFSILSLVVWVSCF